MFNTPIANAHDSLLYIIDRIHIAEQNAHRPLDSVRLIAVSKKQSVIKIREAYQTGQTAFAENYVQEALEKQAILKDLKIEWHFIGNIQSNKTKLIAENFDWVHSVNRLSIAKKLNDQRPKNLNPLNICIEINIDFDPTKSGVLPQDALNLATEIQSLQHLKLRGLMIIPEKNNVDAFQKTAKLYQTLIDTGFSLDTLSMGMSADFEAAIQAGSNMVRIGTAIFGERTVD